MKIKKVKRKTHHKVKNQKRKKKKKRKRKKKKRMRIMKIEEFLEVIIKIKFKKLKK